MNETEAPTALKCKHKTISSSSHQKEEPAPKQRKKGRLLEGEPDGKLHSDDVTVENYLK